MRFTVNRDVFSEAVSFAAKLLPQRPTQPLLSGALIEAIDGEIFLNDCIQRPGSCDRQAICSVHNVWDTARRQLRDTLGSTTLAELAALERCACQGRTCEGARASNG